ncbi:MULTISPECIES: GNAT family N-acetyltransferase [Saccharothrix]|uniref:GNAT family N-acetyltransferase n=1 Tax=Saccharothrix TaxID=2071 RepID=UPI0009686E39|nr:GNAT family N-acetyltransferase [Saccharothrix sp. CB00851]OKI33372.1 GCN5 family acetyltransferase [Saccharothrix sp. CB00851]
MENLRVLTPDDLTACLRLGLDRGWSEEPEKWAFLLRVGTGFGLFDGDELVGTTIVTRFGDEHAAVSMVLVASSHGGRGLGRRLVEHALAFADAPVVSLHATSYGKPLYEKLGFRSVGVVTAHVGAFGGTASGTSRPVTEEDRARVVAVDAEVFGADRSAMWGALFGFASQVRVADDGFVATWLNGPVTMVGPVVAPSVGRAAELVADVAVGATVRVDVRDPALGAWLEAHGVVPRFTAELMVRGAFSGDRARLHAPVMQALG